MRLRAHEYNSDPRLGNAIPRLLHFGVGSGFHVPDVVRAHLWVYTCFLLFIKIFGGPSMLFISRTSSQDEQGQGGSIFSAVTQIGGVLVLSISTIVSDRIAEMGSAKLGIDIVASKTTSSSIPKTALLQGYRAAFWTCFGLSVLAGLIVGVFVRKMGNVGKKDAVSHPDPEASVV